jgi:hypothetical protein
MPSGEVWAIAEYDPVMNRTWVAGTTLGLLRATACTALGVILLTGVAGPQQARAGAGAARPPEPALIRASSTAIVPGAVSRSSIRMQATYAVSVRLGWAARTVRGNVVITARNDSGAGVDRVRLNTVMGPLGRLRLGTVTVDGTARTATLDDQTITVGLGGVLPAGATAVIRVPFRATLRSSTGGSSWLFTRANGIADLYRWVPWISHRTPFARPNHGDPFVTPSSPLVTLRVETDVPLAVTANGTRTSRSADGLVTTWEARDVRDLVVTASRHADHRSATVNGTSIRVVTRPGGPAAVLLRAARRALPLLEARLGPSPWPVLRVVESAGGFGMEGPGVVWIPAGTEAWRYEYLVTHELAHQWFYGQVGNDQAREPFADEAMADMVTRFVLGQRRASRCDRAALDRTIYRYSQACYYEVVYIQGGNLLDNARQTIGTKVFFGAVRQYLAEHRWGMGGTRALLDTLDAATPLDMAARWRSRFPSLY